MLNQKTSFPFFLMAPSSLDLCGGGRGMCTATLNEVALASCCTMMIGCYCPTACGQSELVLDRLWPRLWVAVAERPVEEFHEELPLRL